MKVESLAVTLARIWLVDADATYKVTWSREGQSGWIVLRTLAGQGQMWLDDGPPMTVPAETVLLLDRTRIRRYCSDEDRWHFWWMEFYGAIPSDLNTHRPLDIPIDPSEVSEMQQCFDLLREDRPQASALASAKLGMLLNEWRYHWKGPPRRDRRPHQEALEEVIRLMRRNLREPLSGEELAERVSLSARRFRQIFREATGRSPKQYYDSLRLTMGAELLRMGGVSVADIADRLGYSSAFHFSRAFKKHHGVPPSAYLRP